MTILIHLHSNPPKTVPGTFSRTLSTPTPPKTVPGTILHHLAPQKKAARKTQGSFFCKTKTF